MKISIVINRFFQCIVVCVLILSPGLLRGICKAQTGLESAKQKSGPQQESTETAPRTLSDFVVLPNEEAQVFLADSTTGTIYTYTLTRDTPINIQFSSFQ